MPWGTQELLNQIKEYIPALLVILCSLAGASRQFVNGEKEFSLGLFVFEVLSAMSAGAIIFLFLSAIDMPEQWKGAVTGLVSYFGSKTMSLFYQIFVVKLTSFFKIDNKDDLK